MVVTEAVTEPLVRNIFSADLIFTVFWLDIAMLWKGQYMLELTVTPQLVGLTNERSLLESLIKSGESWDTIGEAYSPLICKKYMHMGDSIWVVQDILTLFWLLLLRKILKYSHFTGSWPGQLNVLALYLSYTQKSIKLWLVINYNISKVHSQNIMFSQLAIRRTLYVICDKLFPTQPKCTRVSRS